MLAIEAAREQAAMAQTDESEKNDLELRFEQVANILRDLDIDRVWAAAEDEEHCVPVEELTKSITGLPEHVEAKVTGAPVLNVVYDEAGLKVPEIVGVGDGT